jgi:S-disulfanyl-L-cysteine oxidoreductase SoxD
MEGMARHVMVLSAVVTVASWGVSVAARAPGASTNDGVYTAAQAAKGQELYGQVCETCHQPAEFTRAYVGRPLSEINHAMAEMPADNPGTLTSDDVAALIAYFLQMNKYPAGQTPLSGAPDALKSILISPRP